MKIVSRDARRHEARVDAARASVTRA